LHDNIGQRLSLLSLHVNEAAKDIPSNPQRSVELLRSVQDGLSAINTSIRETSHRLHPQQIEDLGLIVALRSLCSSYDSNGAKVNCSTPDHIPDVSVEIATTLYRIAQEAVQNALKHAPGAPIKIALTTPDNSLQLSVRDDGPGFDLAEASHNGGLGFSTMQERARLANGKLSIKSRPGQGAEVSVVVPIIPPGGGVDG
jgi:two-component system CheB/CheR fusion protein